MFLCDIYDNDTIFIKLNSKKINTKNFNFIYIFKYFKIFILNFIIFNIINYEI